MYTATLDESVPCLGGPVQFSSVHWKIHLVSPFNEGEASGSAGSFIQGLDKTLIWFLGGVGLNKKSLHIRMMLSPSSLSTGTTVSGPHS